MIFLVFGDQCCWPIGQFNNNDSLGLHFVFMCVVKMCLLNNNLTTQSAIVLLVFFLLFYHNCVQALNDHQRSFDYLVAQSAAVYSLSNRKVIIKDNRGANIAEGFYLDRGDFGSVYRLVIAPLAGVDYVPVALKIPRDLVIDAAEVNKYEYQKMLYRGLSIDFRPLPIQMNSIRRNFVLMELYDTTVAGFVQSIYNDRVERGRLKPLRSLFSGVYTRKSRLQSAIRVSSEKYREDLFTTQLKEWFNEFLRVSYHITDQKIVTRMLEDFKLSNFLVKEVEINRFQFALSDSALVDANSPVLYSIPKAFMREVLRSSNIDVYFQSIVGREFIQDIEIQAQR